MLTNSSRNPLESLIASKKQTLLKWTPFLAARRGVEAEMGRASSVPCSGISRPYRQTKTARRRGSSSAQAAESHDHIRKKICVVGMVAKTALR